MEDHYRHKDMYLEDIFLGMCKTSTEELCPKLDLRYSIWCWSNHSHLNTSRFQLVWYYLMQIVSFSSNFQPFHLVWYSLMQIESFSFNFHPVPIGLVFLASQPNTFSKYEIDRLLFWNDIVTCRSKVRWT